MMPIFPLNKKLCFLFFSIFIAKLKKCNILTKHVFIQIASNAILVLQRLQLSCLGNCMYICNVEETIFDGNGKDI